MRAACLVNRHHGNWHCGNLVMIGVGINIVNPDKHVSSGVWTPSAPTLTALAQILDRSGNAIFDRAGNFITERAA
jgi:hypothetical protein